MRQREPCVYLPASRLNGTLYTGVTSDLIARLYQHRERDNPHWLDLAIGLGFEPLAVVPDADVDPGTRPA